jgi:2-methylaconitate cis-trans-isomerase PrpF
VSATGERRATGLAAAWPAAVEVGDQLAFPAVLMRGGTSRGAFLRAEDLPVEQDARDRVILAVYGSPDPRQIDGIGGANPLTSKVAIVSRSARADADVDYLFGQVSIDAALVDYGGNCGNMLAGVGPFAVDEGLVAAEEPVARVRIFNVNTDRLVVAEVPVSGGRARAAGETAIAGVPGTGAAIRLDFAETAGTLGRGLLPTGEARELLEADGTTFEVSIVDAANPTVFVAAAAVGLGGTAVPGELGGRALARMRAIREAAGRRLGLDSPGIPKVYAVDTPGDRADVDLVGRGLAFGAPHAAYATTVAVCTAAASRIPGTVVSDQVPDARRGAPELRIGHPSGVLSVQVAVDVSGGEPMLRRAAVERTARRIASGLAYVPRSVLA